METTMPQINIPNTIDPAFLASLAGLDQAWGSAPKDPDQLTFVFMTEKLDAVEAALAQYDEKYLEHRKKQRLEELATRRKIEELKGPQGLVLDDKTVLRLTAKAFDLYRHPEKLSVRWEVSRGNFALFPREVILGLADQAIANVEACFENVYQKTEAINAVQITTTLQDAIHDLYEISIDTGWPT